MQENLSQGVALELTPSCTAFLFENMPGHSQEDSVLPSVLWSSGLQTEEGQDDFQTAEPQEAFLQSQDLDTEALAPVLSLKTMASRVDFSGSFSFAQELAQNSLGSWLDQRESETHTSYFRPCPSPRGGDFGSTDNALDLVQTATELDMALAEVFSSSDEPSSSFLDDSELHSDFPSEGSVSRIPSADMATLFSMQASASSDSTHLAENWSASSAPAAAAPTGAASLPPVTFSGNGSAPSNPATLDTVSAQFHPFAGPHSASASNTTTESSPYASSEDDLWSSFNFHLLPSGVCVPRSPPADDPCMRMMALGATSYLVISSPNDESAQKRSARRKNEGTDDRRNANNRNHPELDLHFKVVQVSISADTLEQCKLLCNVRGEVLSMYTTQLVISPRDNNPVDNSNPVNVARTVFGGVHEDDVKDDKRLAELLEKAGLFDALTRTLAATPTLTQCLSPTMAHDIFLVLRTRVVDLLFVQEKFFKESGTHPRPPQGLECDLWLPGFEDDTFRSHDTRGLKGPQHATFYQKLLLHGQHSLRAVYIGLFYGDVAPDAQAVLINVVMWSVAYTKRIRSPVKQKAAARNSNSTLVRENMETAAAASKSCPSPAAKGKSRGRSSRVKKL
ncbi:hypothetical protein CAOG_07961 [Capsaspora owczarzaki ATCC 30864]|uniref:Uncharacterized protein n=1 Tax=Capsaspora owczarzaki (strain ATCC 30864) TaxID=595528 RepID=A0A0D2W0V3_CAPO3|nr:hypothetical protein CAOG_07961 [Capsaspora owczarzaki ATCC 30864]KJE97882.1 hypothetical protein CAOG_007961 [Capsaspora owczarzaki ATCC 30864]|eukprot:XP_004343049.1 hypothetical protein CAOG_07961 [Capsaspora owczarzaki ATCC 30864]